MPQHYFKEDELEAFLYDVSEITNHFDLGIAYEFEGNTTTENRYNLLLATGFLGQEILNRDPERKGEGATKSNLERSLSNLEEYLEEFQGSGIPKTRNFKSKQLRDIRAVYIEVGSYLEENAGIEFEKRDVGFLANASEKRDALEAEVNQIVEELED